MFVLGLMIVLSLFLCCVCCFVCFGMCLCVFAVCDFLFSGLKWSVRFCFLFLFCVGAVLFVSGCLVLLCVPFLSFSLLLKVCCVFVCCLL